MLILHQCSIRVFQITSAAAGLPPFAAVKKAIEARLRRSVHHSALSPPDMAGCHGCCYSDTARYTSC